ncbi:UvrB/UvrC motif-containing protein [Metabacillus sp. RGM 3146]|uniref:UvrB/UvrC motif-containing protein n=1 Tax=Metabacillus sp. RGM 3146 TaxID=3401092 RepID=UPI003B99C9DB
MICQECHERPATFHFTKVINGEKTEVHVCEHCAKENNNMSMFSGESGFSINHLLAGLLKIEPSLLKAEQKLQRTEEEVPRCSRCGMTFHQFSKTSRFGCSHCYKTFSNLLTPILRKVHSGNTEHGGKVPKRLGGSIHTQKRIDLLKSQLRDLIEKEEFESAAEVRDEIRSLEKSMSSHREEGS